MINFRYISVLILSVTSSLLFGENRTSVNSNLPDVINFERYGTEEGLANPVVYDILQDDNGFLWMGTGNGVSRFDGYEFTNYRPDKDDPSAIGQGPAPDVFLDSRGRIWVAVVGSGLFLYNEDEDNFKAYVHDPDKDGSLSSDNTYGIAEDQNGSIWVSTTDKGLNRLVEESDSFIHYRHDPDNANGINTDKTFALLVDQDNNLWISTVGGGLNRYDISRDLFSVPLEGIAQSVSLTEVKNGDIWIPTIGTGLYRFNRNSDDFTHFNYNENDESGLSHNSLIRVMEDSRGTLWLSTWGGGLNAYDPVKNNFKVYKNDPDNTKSLSSDDIWGLFEDRSGVLWIGSYGTGINSYDRKTERFSFIRNNPDELNSLRGNNVKSVFEDSEGYLWIGTLGGGLNRYHPLTGQYDHYVHDSDDSSSISDNFISMISEDQSRDLWIATDNGLSRYNRKSDDFTQFLNDENDPDSISNDIVRSVYVDSGNRVWAGTQFGSINQFDRETGGFIRYPFTGVYLASIFEDSRKNLYYGNVTGLFQYDESNDTFFRTLGDPDNPDRSLDLFVTAIGEDINENLWIGSISGLVRLDLKTGMTALFQESDGMIDDAIAGFLSDDKGNLWISTSKGLSVFFIESEQFKNYEIGPFNRNSYFESKEGEFFFGSFNGLVHFFPDEVKDNQIIPPVVLTSFKIFNQEVKLSGSLSDLRDFELDHKDNFFSFEFAALDYSNPGKNQYRYKLEGFDKDWIEVPSRRRFASYTNLDGGDYIFRVMASNNDGVWNESGIALNLHINPPFRDTLIFKLLVTICSLIVFSLIFFYIITLRNALKKQRVSEREIIKLKKYQSDIIDSMPSVLVGVNSRGLVTQWNRSASELTSIPTESARGQYLQDLLPRMFFKMENVFSSIQSGEIIREADKKIDRDDGIEYIDMTIYPLTESEVKGAVIRIDDVTSKHQLLEELNHRSKMDAIGQLAGGIAHDFNNMLGGILNAAQLLKSPLRQMDETSLKYTDMIIRASSRAADLTSKLMTFGRKGGIDLDHVDIHEIIDETLSILNRTLDKKIDLNVEKKTDNPNIIGNSTALQNILLNLCINASHAMPEGGKITIRTSSTDLNRTYCDNSPFHISPGLYCKIEVKDTGSGIESENIKKIFEPFYTTKEPGKGTGLGLAAVYGTILDHNGAIDVISEIGTGTTFNLLLHCSDEDPQTKKESDEIIPGKGLILLVDDEELIRATGKDILIAMGYKVILAENGLNAIATFKEYHNQIDLVILDMIMPGLSGRDTYYQLKDIDRHCRIIIASGFAKEDHMDELRKSGISGFLRKPYVDTELSQLLASVLKNNNK